jgi:hypothetical protein
VFRLLQYAVTGILFECAKDSLEGTSGKGDQETNAGRRRRMEGEFLAATSTQYEKSGVEALLCGERALSHAGQAGWRERHQSLTFDSPKPF